MNLFFCPTIFEIPFSYLKQTESFGMGRKKAEALAQKLNELSFESVVIFGSAGALRSDFKTGQCFAISEVIDENGTSLSLNQTAPPLPTAKLYTSRRILRDQEEKKRIHQELGADLVDMEMFYFFKNLKEEKRAKIIFIRGVIDCLEDRLLQFTSLHRLPVQFIAYQRGMKQALKKHCRANHFT